MAMTGCTIAGLRSPDAPHSIGDTRISLQVIVVKIVFNIRIAFAIRVIVWDSHKFGESQEH